MQFLLSVLTILLSDTLAFECFSEIMFLDHPPVLSAGRDGVHHGGRGGGGDGVWQRVPGALQSHAGQTERTETT